MTKKSACGWVREERERLYVRERREVGRTYVDHEDDDNEGGDGLLHAPDQRIGHANGKEEELCSCGCVTCLHGRIGCETTAAAR